MAFERDEAGHLYLAEEAGNGTGSEGTDDDEA